MSEAEIFAAALEKAAGAERDAYLAEACAGDKKVRRRVEALLRASAESDDILDPPLRQGTIDYIPITERVGTKIGPYILREQIGEGGFGLVFVAEQTEPVKRKVALKIIKPGMDTREVMARFTAERQALALMDHPNIAKVLDAGATDTGRPYFVMELVRGIPITEYCDKNQLPPRERLDLFVTVCQAIQHAHQKGIIHRDIKPSNVLVTSHDGNPVAKVIDFGVAKAIHHQLTDRSIYTNFAQMIGTPLYMSPEQAEMSGLDIDTRSDIYSLGVLLYELLTGATPFEKKRFAKAAYDEIRRIIREEEPPKPSTRISTSDSMASIAALRHTEPAKLSKLLRGDLDWITMKALEKDRTRRYETANGLAMDIKRFLSDEPVVAGPPGRIYRIQKFLRRNRGPVLAASLVFLALIGGIISTSIGLQQARVAERAALESAQVARQSEADTHAVLKFFEERVLAAARPKGQAGGLGRDATIRQAIAQAEGQIADGFRDKPAIEASIRSVVGETYLHLGDQSDSVRHFERARSLAEQAWGPDDRRTLTVCHNLATAYGQAGRHQEALKLLEDTWKKRQSLLGDEHTDTLLSVNNLGMLFVTMGRHADAVPLLEQAFRTRERLHGTDDAETLTTQNNLAMSYQNVGQLRAALPHFEHVLERRRHVLGPDHPNTLASHVNLAIVCRDLGDLSRAIPLAETTAQRCRTVLTTAHPYTLAALNCLMSVYSAAGRGDEAVEQAMELVQLTSDRLGADHPNTVKVQINSGAAYVVARRWADVERIGRETRDRTPPGSADRAATLGLIGEALLRTGRARDAVPSLREAISIREKLTPQAWQRFALIGLLGMALSADGQFVEAERQLQAAIAGINPTLPDALPIVRGRLEELQTELARLRDRDRAKP